MPNPLVTALHVYPVKSMKGISLSQATLTARGLQHDRIWMVVAADGRFVTQRNQPRLGLVHTRLEAEGVVLALEGCGSVTLPYDAVAGKHIATQVWGDACDTVDQGPEASEWLTRAVGSPVALHIVRMAPGFTRPQNQPLFTVGVAKSSHSQEQSMGDCTLVCQGQSRHIMLGTRVLHWAGVFRLGDVLSGP